MNVDEHRAADAAVELEAAWADAAVAGTRALAAEYNRIEAPSPDRQLFSIREIYREGTAGGPDWKAWMQDQLTGLFWPCEPDALAALSRWPFREG